MKPGRSARPEKSLERSTFSSPTNVSICGASSQNSMCFPFRCRRCGCSVMHHIHTVRVSWRVHQLRVILHGGVVSSAVLLDGRRQRQHHGAQSLLVLHLHRKNICRALLFVSLAIYGHTSLPLFKIRQHSASDKSQRRRHTDFPEFNWWCLPKFHFMFWNQTKSYKVAYLYLSSCHLKSAVQLCSHSNDFLQRSSGLDEPGTVPWHLGVSLLVAWLLTYLFICRGPSLFGKVRAIFFLLELGECFFFFNTLLSCTFVRFCVVWNTATRQKKREICWDSFIVADCVR